MVERCQQFGLKSCFEDKKSCTISHFCKSEFYKFGLELEKSQRDITILQMSARFARPNFISTLCNFNFMFWIVVNVFFFFLLSFSLLNVLIPISHC